MISEMFWNYMLFYFYFINSIVMHVLKGAKQNKNKKTLSSLITQVIILRKRTAKILTARFWLTIE